MTHKSYTLKHDNGAILGYCTLRQDGWYFIPNVSSRSPSRRGHATADACLPRWAKAFLAKGGQLLPPEVPAAREPRRAPALMVFPRWTKTQRVYRELRRSMNREDARYAAPRLLDLYREGGRAGL